MQIAGPAVGVAGSASQPRALSLSGDGDVGVQGVAAQTVSYDAASHTATFDVGHDYRAASAGLDTEKRYQQATAGTMSSGEPTKTAASRIRP